MTNVFRCNVCRYEFEGPKGAHSCPKCGSMNDIRHTAVARLACIHLDDRSQRCVKRICCTGEPWSRRGLFATNYCLAVTCPRCKETEAYKAAMADANQDRQHDIPR